jgi:hypothetical protein
MQEALLASLLAAVQFFQRQGGKPRVQRGVRRPRLAVAGEHLVIRLAQFVTGIGRINPGPRIPAWPGDDIGAAKILGIRESFMLHARSLTGLSASRKRGGAGAMPRRSGGRWHDREPNAFVRRVMPKYLADTMVY